MPRRSGVAETEEQGAGEQGGGGPGGEHTQARPGADWQGAQAGAGLDAQASCHRADLLEVALQARAPDYQAQDRDQVQDSPDPGAAFFGFLDRLATEAGPKRDLFDALASAGVEVGPAVMAAAEDLRAQITGLLGRAQQAGAVRADLGRAELTALLSGLLCAMQPRPGGDQEIVLSVFRDGLRPPPLPAPGAVRPG